LVFAIIEANRRFHGLKKFDCSHKKSTHLADWAELRREEGVAFQGWIPGE
jgi:hypothetical protein